MRVLKVVPPWRTVEAKGLPARRKGLFSKGPAVLTVPPDQAAVVEGGDAVHAPAGTQPVELELAPDSRAAAGKREIEVEMAMDDLVFADDREGGARLLARVRLFGGAGHPVALAMTGGAGAFEEALGDCLSRALERPLREAFAAMKYRPGMATEDAARAIGGLHARADVLESVEREAGAGFYAPLVVTAVSAPSVDADREAVRRAREEAERGRIEAAAEIARIAQQIPVNDAIQSKVMQEFRHKGEKELLQERIDSEKRIERERADAEARAQRAKAAKEEAEARSAGHAARLKEVEAELRSLELDARKAELDGRREEAERLRTEAERARAEEARLAAEIGSLTQAVTSGNATLGELRAVVEMLTRQLDELKGDGDRREPERPLELFVTWRAHNAEGVVVPEIGRTETLPSSTMLDVMVTTTKDAWVYVLLRGSTGRWQCLVPDTGALMGIRRPNRQKAAEPVVWPGENRRRPGSPPLWILDKSPGYERVIVVASLDELDPNSILRGDAVEELRRRAAPVRSRGFGNPGDASPAGALPVSDYSRVVTGLVGDGIVVHESVIVHTPA